MELTVEKLVYGGEGLARQPAAERELAPYRRKMTAPQIEQALKQYVNKKLLDAGCRGSACSTCRAWQLFLPSLRDLWFLLR